ncbi:hypothetical protein DENIS_1205 [Desulfonema ishimotonii]|uniref:Uncharacterized protein n=2 Tax=Desulfonema ishimotonii TaxID=45657 RepID=A0A401FTH7_9BACT|nr:hypothetical protein DENIS_1205 [Desulfonema ishimotonii]
MMSNLGLFYIILIALFAIPLLGTFVVVLIKGVLSFQYVILGAGVILGGLLIFYGGKLCFRLYRKIREDGIMAVREAQARAGQGEPVQIAFFNGLFTFSSGGWKGPQAQALPHHQGNVALLPEATGGRSEGMIPSIS